METSMDQSVEDIRLRHDATLEAIVFRQVIPIEKVEVNSVLVSSLRGKPYCAEKHRFGVS